MIDWMSRIWESTAYLSRGPYQQEVISLSRDAPDSVGSDCSLQWILLLMLSTIHDAAIFFTAVRSRGSPKPIQDKQFPLIRRHANFVDSIVDEVHLRVQDGISVFKSK